MKKIKLVVLISMFLLPLSIVKADDLNDKDIINDDIIVSNDNDVDYTSSNEMKNLNNNINNTDAFVQTGWQLVDGNLYYYDKNGNMLKGIHEIDGYNYLFGVNSGKLYKNGLATTPDGNVYFTNENGIVQTGWKTIDSNIYYFAENGVMQKGIVEINGNKYLFGVNSGKLYKSGLASTPDGNIYFTDEDGIVQTGWKTIDLNIYYFAENGVMQKGIVEINGNKYLFGVNSGKLYKNGLASTPDGNIYFTDEDGIIQTGWKKIDSNIYHFDDSGKMMTYSKKINNDVYYYDNKGNMLKGIQEIDGNKYLFGVNSGKLYKNGLATTPDGSIYYTNENGIVQTGWKTIDSNIYYFAENGVMQKGVIEIDGNKYLFGVNSGKLYKDGFATTPDGNTYYTNLDGIIQTGDLEIDGRWYRFNSSGILQSGWQTINGNKYYFNLNGSVVTGVAKIAGMRYLFSSAGILLNSNVKTYVDVSFAQGNIDWDTLWSSGEIDGAILRIGFGSLIEQLDSQFINNLKAVKRLGIPYTIYLYSYAENSNEAFMEADNLLKWINKYDVNITSGLPIYLDIEEFGTNASAIAKYCEVIPSFVSRMNSHGLMARVYANAYTARSVSENVRNYIDWIALYNSDNTYEYSWNGWQYTSNGRASGVSTRIDFSVFK